MAVRGVMERKLQERMVGAGVLILALVLLGPVILDGGGEKPARATLETGTDELRTHTFQLEGSAAPAKVLPVPVQPPTRSDAASQGAEAAAAKPVATRASADPTPDNTISGESAVRQPTPVATSSQARDPVGSQEAVAIRLDPNRDTAGKTTARAPQPSGAAAFLVQVGTFGQKPNAERLAAGLRQRGFEAFVSSTTREGKTLHRVRVGPPGSREKIDVIAGRLAEAGQSGQVVRE